MAIGDKMKVTSYLCIGGRSVMDDKRNLEQGVQIVIGTPGRVFDLIESGHLRKSFNLLKSNFNFF
jgi:translation initiation factor 4A